MTITAIRGSDDLAAILNAQPLTPEDAAETPRDWLPGIWVNGTTYPLDEHLSTETLAVLADGTAAVRLTEPGEYCGRPCHNHYQAHWCPADTDTAEWGDDIGVERDWRTVRVYSGSYTDTTVYPTLEQAKAAFDREEAELDQAAAEAEAEAAMEQDMLNDQDEELLGPHGETSDPR